VRVRARVRRLKPAADMQNRFKPVRKPRPVRLSGLRIPAVDFESTATGDRGCPPTVTRSRLPNPGAFARVRRLKPAADMQNRFKPVRKPRPVRLSGLRIPAVDFESTATGDRGCPTMATRSRLPNPGAFARARRLKPAADIQNRFKPVRRPGGILSWCILSAYVPAFRRSASQA